jgi:hypothetical protein
MRDFVIPDHAIKQMAADNITEDDLYTAVHDYDEILEYSNGRNRYSRFLEDGRHIVVVIEHDGETVVTAWLDKQRSRRQHRRR